LGQKWARDEVAKKPSFSTLYVHCEFSVAEASATFGLQPDVDVARNAEGPTS
jgi:hypothetical protein